MSGRKEEIKAKLKQFLTGERYIHTLGVEETVVKLAERYNVDPEKASLAGLLHDCARDMEDSELLKVARIKGLNLTPEDCIVPGLLHGPIGAILAEENYGIRDREVLEAISCHTLGKAKMSPLDKILYLADMIEPGRKYPSVEFLRSIAYNDLERAVLEGFQITIKYVLDEKFYLHPRTVEARNHLLLEGTSSY